MFARLKASLRSDPKTRAIVFVGALLILAAIVMAAISHAMRNISGEAFYDFQFPYRFPLNQAWKVFFLERIRSRLMHGVFITILYNLVGYNPPAIYLALYILVIATSALIVFNLRRYLSQPWQAGLLTAVFALLPIALPELIELKKAHHVLAWFAFWLAVSFLSIWMRTDRKRWLLAGTLAFLASVLAYEATVALLPIAVLLALPRLKDFKDMWRKIGVILFITLCTALAFLRLEDLKPYTGIGQAYPGYSDPNATVSKAFSAVPKLLAAIWNGQLFGVAAAGWMQIAGTVLLLACVLSATYAVYLAFHRRPGRQASFRSLQQPAVVLTLAALYLTLATYLPFMLAGQAPDTDSLRGAGIGLVLLAIAGMQGLVAAGRERWGVLLFAALAGFLLGAGLFGFRVADRKTAIDDVKLNRFIYTLRQEIPGVRGGANFVFVNSGVGRTGCIGLMNMLYGRDNLHCIHLFDDDVQERYVRVEPGLQEVGDRLFDSGFILLTMAPDGSAIVLDQITQKDFPNLPITWLSNSPLLPDESYILRPASAYDSPSKAEGAAIKMLRLQPASTIYDYVSKQAAP